MYINVVYIHSIVPICWKTVEINIFSFWVLVYGLIIRCAIHNFGS